MIYANVKTFCDWREKARCFLSCHVSPDSIQWLPPSELPLFASESALKTPTSGQISVPKPFVPLAQIVSCHTEAKRWHLLYRTLWRITHGEPHLFNQAMDTDMSELLLMQKSVRRDIHKMHAFVRFNSAERNGEEFLHAWFEPQYFILEVATPFFARRFGSIHWKITTPQGSATWDKMKLRFDSTDNLRPELSDDVDELWRDYYGSIFNPARINLDAMTKEMPVRNWKNLPEARIISSLIQQAPRRVMNMRTSTNQAEIPDLFKLPTKQAKLSSLATASGSCTGCPLYQHATQTVFGEGPSNAKLVFVGEQPGDEEDKTGHPFVGPAGKLLNDALVQADIDRREIYITNAVKHFKFEDRGKQRLHKKPNSGEIHACRSWLMSELTVLKPEIIVCLGGTAAQSVLGRAVKVTEERGKVLKASNGSNVFITVHPSSILRALPELKQNVFKLFLEDLMTLKQLL